jgi:O-succinylbenzoic acid--CoA ligase
MISGPALFSGTLRPDEAGWKYEERRGEWFTSSDLGRVQGRLLWIEGRADALVKILGELVDPIAVESEVLALATASPGSAVVVAVPDPRAGSRLVLIHENVEHYHAGCAGYCRISSILGIESIPKSELGKPQRALLSRFAAQRSI